MRGFLFLPSKLLTLFFISDHLEQILCRLSKAIIPDINVTHPRRKLIPHMLHDLIGLKNRPMRLGMALCSVTCGNKIED